MKKISVFVGSFMMCVALNANNIYAAGGACNPSGGKIEVSKVVGACNSIQSAINAADGINPVVITVLPGTYTENISITKSNIDLQGVDPNFTIISGYDISVYNSATPINNIAISGFSLIDGRISLSTNISKLAIKNNFITGDVGGAGIQSFATGNDISIKNNNLAAAISGNGISFDGNFTNAVIEGNIVKDNGGSGIYTGSSDAKIINNIVTNNGTEGGYGIHCRPNGSNKCLVKGNTVTGTSMNGIYVEGGNEIKVVDNVATGNNTQGSPSYGDIASYADQDTHISFNVCDTIIGTKGTNYLGNFNVKSNGDSQP